MSKNFITLTLATFTLFVNLFLINTFLLNKAQTIYQPETISCTYKTSENECLDDHESVNYYINDTCTARFDLGESFCMDDMTPLELTELTRL